MKRVGFTGGACSGKTTAMRFWRALGVPVLCADEIAREATRKNGPLLEPIRDAFGGRFFDADGDLARRALRTHILHDKDAKQRLEAIIHPYVRREMLAWLEGAREPYRVVVVPLLVETGMHKRFDLVVTLECAREAQIDRLVERDHCPRAEAERMLENQASTQERIAVSDEIIRNDGDKKRLKSQIIELHDKITSLCHRQAP